MVPRSAQHWSFDCVQDFAAGIRFPLVIAIIKILIFQKHKSGARLLFDGFLGSDLAGGGGASQGWAIFAGR